uniref:Major facilitator superfamily (MFS) profile domain-containing protein n=1 Tax=Leersia perrieri TaxID=77586 RepID=A0A0D9Y1U8_9ORYZ
MDGMEKKQKQQQLKEEAMEMEEDQYQGWKSMPYVIGNETFEKLGTIGTTANLLVYLTTVYHLPSARAATLVNFFSGTTNLAPLVSAFLSDTFFGRFPTIAAASLSSFLGMLLLTLTAALPSLHPQPCRTSSSASSCHGPSRWQMAALLSSFAFLVAGAGGIRPCNLAFGADQFDPRTDSGRRGIASFFNWYYFTFTVSMMISATLIIYLQSNVSWAIGLAVPAALMALSCALFFIGTRLYVRVKPEGSPFTSFAQVFVAAVRNRHRSSASPLFDPPHRSKLVAKIAYTDQFRCLDKAAAMVVEPDTSSSPNPNRSRNPWRLCSVQQVEEVKCLVRMTPVWSAGIVYFIVLTHLGTYVVFQAMQTDRRLGQHFQIPPGSMVVFNMLALTVWIPLYDRLIVPALTRITRRDGGITQLQRIGVGLVLSVAAVSVAAAVEHRRRRLAAGDGIIMSCFWLVPQQVLAGMSEAFAMIGQTEFYYKQFPENMRSVAGALFFLAFAVASYASGFMVAAVHRTTGWLAQDLDHGRLDLFYLLVAAIAAANVGYFFVCARWYRFKKTTNSIDMDDVELQGSSNGAVGSKV